MEETVIEKNTCIYDSINYTHILKVGNTVMTIENMMESEIVVAFDNEKNHVLTRVGRIETNVVSINKVRYVHPNNPTLIKILTCS